MVNQLFEVFKALLLIAGCLVLINIIVGIVTEPIKQKNKKKAIDEFLKDLEDISNKCIEELKKQEEKPKKNTRNTKKSKEN